MPADSQTFLLLQLLIASVAFLCISVAYIGFLRNKIKKLTPGKNFVFEYAYDGARAGKKKNNKDDESEIDMLGDLSGEQFHLGAQLKEMASEKDVNTLSDKDREALLKQIDALEASLERSGRQIASMKVQYQRVSHGEEHGGEKEEKVVNSPKKSLVTGELGSADGSNNREKSLLEKVSQLKDDLENKDREIKKLRVNSSLMTKELDDLKLDNLDSYELKQSLEETEQKLKRSEAERELLERNFVELAEGARSTKDLEDEILRMKKEYEMLEQRFIGSGAA